jgi:hypothetical protein
MDEMRDLDGRLPAPHPLAGTGNGLPELGGAAESLVVREHRDGHDIR